MHEPLYKVILEYHLKAHKVTKFSKTVYMPGVIQFLCAFIVLFLLFSFLLFVFVKLSTLCNRSISSGSVPSSAIL